MATTNGSTAIRDKILASLARYRALRIGKFPCAFWRLSARPGLTAGESLFLRKLVLGISAQASSKNLTRPLMPPAAPIRPRHLVPTQQGVGT
ncbi:hypothetical protein [Bathymodiolus japonicus methanotrophic gill symbiont]|uniref:hypothetical protein n=1 Tax=Bathymodiolus japonicus methanotrophic gill symbiont TaxID=113269 RepID=UPI001C8EBDC2|nr:hypothetical protein [Bathymodiolus japonicus methanotrophic gill symbiont]